MPVSRRTGWSCRPAGSDQPDDRPLGDRQIQPGDDRRRRTTCRGRAQRRPSQPLPAVCRAGSDASAPEDAVPTRADQAAEDDQHDPHEDVPVISWTMPTITRMAAMIHKTVPLMIFPRPDRSRQCPTTARLSSSLVMCERPSMPAFVGKLEQLLLGCRVRIERRQSGVGLHPRARVAARDSIVALSHASRSRGNISFSSSSTWCPIPPVSMSTAAPNPGSDARFGERLGQRFPRQAVFDGGFLGHLGVDLDDERIQLLLLELHVQREGVGQGEDHGVALRTLLTFTEPAEEALDLAVVVAQHRETSPWSQAPPGPSRWGPSETAILRAPTEKPGGHVAVSMAQPAVAMGCDR